MEGLLYALGHWLGTVLLVCIIIYALCPILHVKENGGIKGVEQKVIRRAFLAVLPAVIVWSFIPSMYSSKPKGMSEPPVVQEEVPDMVLQNQPTLQDKTDSAKKEAAKQNAEAKQHFDNL